MLGFQCVELSERFLDITHHWAGLTANEEQVARVSASAHGVPLIANGRIGVAPHVGDVMSFSTRPDFTDTGHTGVVPPARSMRAGAGPSHC